MVFGGYSMMLGLLDSAYAAELKTSEGSTKLLVLFSSSLNHAFYSYDFGCHTLYIADKNYTYFVEAADVLSSAIDYTARHLGVKSIVYMGTSKGGYGALLHASLPRVFDRFRRHAIAFGPQTQIFPVNENINFPSYTRLAAKLCDGDQPLVEAKTFGRLPSPYPASATIYYSGKNSIDRIESERVSGPDVKHVPLAMAGHLSHLPFVIDTSDEAAVRRVVEKAYAQGVKIGDQVDDNRAEYVAELLAMPRQPSIIDIVYSVE